MRRGAVILVVCLAAALVADVASAACTHSPTLCGLTVTSTIEQPQLERAIDVVLLGDGFTAGGDWASVAASAIATFKSYSATGLYGSVPQLYNFHVVDVVSATTDVADDDRSDTALGMKVTGAFIGADQQRVATAALNAPDVDVVIALANSNSGRANANYPAQLASGGSIRMSRNLAPIAHELGHALVHLADEYEEASLCAASGEVGLVREPNVTADSTCAKFAHVTGAGCVQGGRYCSSGLWRPAVGCLMRTTGNAAPCPVCAAEIRHTLLEHRTGVDRGSPWVVASNVPSAPISGRLEVTALVADHGFGGTTVSFAVDGRHAGAQVASDGALGKATLAIDTRRLADGAHVLELFADDAAGHSRRGVPVTFTSANHVLPGAVVVTMHSPSDASTAHGSVFVSAGVGATDPVPALLTLEADGVPVLGAPRTRTLNASWDVSALPLGPRSLRVVASYESGQVFASGAVVVTLAAQGEGTSPGQGNEEVDDRPRVYLNQPRPWSAVGPLVPIAASFGRASVGPIDVLVRLDEGAPTLLETLTLDPSPPASIGLVIDASGWSEGPHVIEILARRGATILTSDPLPLVRVPAEQPAGFIRAFPTSASVKGVVQVGLVGHASPAVAALELRSGALLLGNVAGAAGTVAWDTRGFPDRCTVLTVTARSTSGASSSRDDRTVCVDNTAPAVTITEPASDAVVGTGTVWVGVATTDVGGTVQRLEVLIDGQSAYAGVTVPGLVRRFAPGAHTLQARAHDGAGNVTSSSAVTITVADCATTGCDDGNTCTVDSCAPDGCHHVPRPGCCRTALDCDDGDGCTSDTCDGGTCRATPRASCCNQGWDCRDGDPCTRDQCTNGTCTNPAGECCSAAADCNDAWACTTDVCVTGAGGACANDRAGDCCRGDTDCDDGDACTADACSGGTCTHARSPGCCTVSGDCDDGKACTFDYCDASTNTCRAATSANCCTSNADCESLDPCTSGTCDLARGSCTKTRSPSCCTFGFECNDFDPCTRDTCSASACGHATMDVCCMEDTDCDDGDPCTAGACDGGSCLQLAIPGCCAGDAACDDGDPCTAEICGDDHTCDVVALPACCADDADCDDGNACTTNRCDANACLYEPIDGCCTDVSECDDGDPCTADACAAGGCSHHAVAGCCATPGACQPQDGSEDPLERAGSEPTRIAGGCSAAAPSLLAVAIACAIALRRRQRANTCRSTNLR